MEEGSRRIPPGSDLAKQFEFTQQDRVNNGNFRQPNSGPDPLIGQPSGKCLFPNDYGVSPGQPFAFGGFVNMVSGEYLFAPSITYLRSFKHPA